MPGLARDPGADLILRRQIGPAMRARRPPSHHACTLEKPRGVRAALRPLPATYPAMPVVSCCGNWGGVPGFPEAQIEHLGELIVQLVTARPRPVQAHACHVTTVVLCLRWGGIRSDAGRADGYPRDVRPCRR